MDDLAFRRDFFRRLTDAALEPDDPLYVPIYEDTRVAADDPIALMQATIEWTVGASVQLFSGFRGSGKSTELRRLRARLRNAGYVVLLFDAEEYLNVSLPVDVPDFLLAMMEALGETAVREGCLAEDPVRVSYWHRFQSFLRGIHLDELSAEMGMGPAKVGLKANLRNDPGFSRKLQERMAGHLGAFVDDVRSYVTDISALLTERHPDSAGIVLIVDSIEHIRGISANAEEVQRSVESLFAVHASKLHLPGLHVVYTVPPWLKVLYPGLSSLYEPGGVQVLRRATALPVTDDIVDRALAAARNELLPIAEEDARWLARIAADHDVALPEIGSLPSLARFLDTHLVLCYRNGEEWYDVHPLIREVVLGQAAH